MSVTFMSVSKMDFSSCAVFTNAVIYVRKTIPYRPGGTIISLINRKQGKAGCK